MESVQKVASLFLACLLLSLCFLQTRPDFSSKAVVLQVTHAHEAEEHDHEHGSSESAQHSHQHATDGQETHEHTLVVPMAQLTLAVAEVHLTLIQEVPSSLGLFKEDGPPADRSLDALFRPPIQA